MLTIALSVSDLLNRQGIRPLIREYTYVPNQWNDPNNYHLTVELRDAQGAIVEPKDWGIDGFFFEWTDQEKIEREEPITQYDAPDVALIGETNGLMPIEGIGGRLVWHNPHPPRLPASATQAEKFKRWFEGNINHHLGGYVRWDRAQEKWEWWTR